MQRSSGPMGIDLDNAEWEKRVMNSWPKKCTFVVREILQTERAYIASLEEIILGYMMPLHGYLLSQGEGPNFIHNVFSNINKLRQLHEHLLDELYSACGNPHNFADVFVETDFCQYREYCTHYTDANLFLQKSMAENGKLKLFITQCQHDLDHLLPLNSHLIKPVQRILKYQLMLQELLKYIDEEDVIYPDVKEALEKMRNVAEEINTSFMEERSNKEATPSVIARKRSKEIKSLQRSRTEHRRLTVPKELHEATELQRSMEFEDSLTLLWSSGKSSVKQSDPAMFNTVGPRRKTRAPLTHLIDFFEAAKLSQDFSSGSSPPLPKLHAAHPPVPTTDTSPEQSSTELSDPPSPDAHRKLTLANSVIAASPENKESVSSTPVLSQVRKVPLSHQKSTPIVRGNMVEAVGEKQNSISDTAHSQLLLAEKEAAEKADIADVDHTSKVAESLNLPLTIPQRLHSTLPVGKIKQPLLPPKQLSVPPESLPPATCTPSPPSTTFFPSMLKPVKNATSVRSSVFMRQDWITSELKGGGSRRTDLPGRNSPAIVLNSAEKDAGEGERVRKAPMLPPTVRNRRTCHLAHPVT